MTTREPHPQPTFQTTSWSLILAAPDDPARLEELLTAYWGPIYAFIRRSGRSPEEALDLTQEFISRVVLERGMLRAADPHRGRFRTFLKASLRNFLIDEHRRATSTLRSPGRPIASGAALERYEPPESASPADAFDRQWAASMLAAALAALERDCRACGQEVHWTLFEEFVIHPALGGGPAPSHEELASRHALAGPPQVAALIYTVRRKFRRAVSEVVAATLSDPGEVEDEVRSLRRFLNGL